MAKQTIRVPNGTTDTFTETEIDPTHAYEVIEKSGEYYIITDGYHTRVIKEDDIRKP